MTNIPADISTDFFINVGATGTSSTDFEGDRDWVRVALVTGGVYEIALSGDDSSGAALSDPLLILRDGDGDELARDDDGGEGLNALLTHTASFTGDHILDLGAFEGLFGGGTGDYVVSVTEISSPPGGGGGAGDIAIGSVTRDAIEAEGDEDEFTVTLTSGVAYRFAATGTGDAGGLADPTLTLSDAAGAQLAFDDDGGEGLNAEIVFTPTSSGAFVLTVGAFLSATGDYDLAVEQISGAGTGATPVAVGSSTRDTIESSGDEDVFSVSLDAGATYRFAATGTGDAGGLPDPTLTLTDAGGAQLAFDDDGGQGLNSEIVFTARSSGEFRLIVAGFDTSTGEYELVVQDRTGAETPTGPADRSRGTLSDDVLFGGGSPDVIRGLAGDDALSGRAGDDRLIGGQGRDTLRGGGGEDTVLGGGSGDRLLGNGADDQIRGGGGADIMVGGGGEDTLRGGGGDDRLTGGRGEDVLVGNGGADRFIFASGHGKNVISDFSEASGDKIQILSGADSFADLDFRITDLGVVVSFGAAEVLLAGLGGGTPTPGGGRKDDEVGFSTGGLEADDFIF